MDRRSWRRFEEHMTPEHKKFLDELMESGRTNMYGATPYLMQEFGIDRAEARKILLEWMKS